MRHGVITDYDPGPFVSISTLAYDYPSRYEIPEHAHGSGQLIYATSGVMEISSGSSLWLAPPQFGLWIPPGVLHSIRMPGCVAMRTLYLRRTLAGHMPRSCAVLHVRPLLRELIVEIVRIGKLSTRDALHRALRDLILSELARASPVQTRLQLPRDARALQVARLCLAEQRAKHSLPDLCAAGAVSVRTVERIFQSEIGISFEAWRRQAKVTKAIELLLAGNSVKETAFEVGYERPGTLIAAFRLATGQTPREWLRGLAAGGRATQADQFGDGASTCSTTRNVTGA